MQLIMEMDISCNVINIYNASLVKSISPVCRY